jgi:hypothetical protein
MDETPPTMIPSKAGWRNWLLIAIGAGAVLSPDLSSLDLLLSQHGLGGAALLAANWNRIVGTLTEQLPEGQRSGA